MKAGGLDAAQRATLEVDRRLAAYRPIETDPAVDRELRAIIRAGLREQTELPTLPPATEPTIVDDPAAGRRRNPRREPRRPTTRQEDPPS